MDLETTDNVRSELDMFGISWQDDSVLNKSEYSTVAIYLDKRTSQTPGCMMGLIMFMFTPA